MMIAYCFVLYLVMGLCHCLGEVPEEEQYVLNFDSPVYVCPDDASQAFLNSDKVEVERYNETVSLMRGSFQYLQDLKSCVLIELIVEKNTNGRVEAIVTHEICDMCSEMGPESNYYRYFKYFGFPDHCPFEAKEIPINDFVAESEDLPVNKANEGRYQVTLNFYDNPDCDCKDGRDFRGCLKLDFLIEPL